MAETIIHKVSKSSDYETVIFFDPPERRSELENWLNNDYRLFVQEGESLGDRMIKAFDKVFALGTEKAVIIGTDCVEISHELICQAFNALQVADVVLGPAEDGGYYLLGLKQGISEIFDGISWSTNLVLDQTLENIREKGLKFQLLKTLKDIDTTKDLSNDLLLRIHEGNKYRYK